MISFAIFCHMEKPLDRLDLGTLHGLVRAMMTANFEDAINAKNSINLGTTWDEDNSDAKSLERALMTLSQMIEKAMFSGDLTPFNGDYRKWLVDIGLISASKFEENR